MRVMFHCGQKRGTHTPCIWRIRRMLRFSLKVFGFFIITKAEDGTLLKVLSKVWEV
jgi:hypothetical protein